MDIQGCRSRIELRHPFLHYSPHHFDGAPGEPDQACDRAPG